MKIFIVWGMIQENETREETEDTKIEERKPERRKEEINTEDIRSGI